MGVKVESPARETISDLTAIDLQLFDAFAVQSEESMAELEAQAQEAPSGDDTGAAQEETGDDHEHSGDVDEASEGETDESDEAQAEDDSEAPSQESWVVPGKFRTTEDVLKAQQNAEKQLGRLHREVAQLHRELEELRSRGASASEIESKEKQIQTQEERARLSKELLREFLKDPIAYNERLTKQILEEQNRIQEQQRLEAERRLKTANAGIEIVAGKYQDFAEIKDQVEDVIVREPVFRRILQGLQSDPNATAEEFASLLDAAYRIAKAEVATAALGAAREQGRREAQQANRARQSSRVAGQGVRRDQTEESVEDSIRRAIREAGQMGSLWME